MHFFALGAHVIEKNRGRSFAKRGVDFRSGWALCCWRFAFAQIKHLPLTLRFRAEQSFLGASGQQDVGHEGVITGRDAFSLFSPPASLRCRVSVQQMFFARKCSAT